MNSFLVFPFIFLHFKFPLGPQTQTIIAYAYTVITLSGSEEQTVHSYFPFPVVSSPEHEQYFFLTSANNCLPQWTVNPFLQFPLLLTHFTFSLPWDIHWSLTYEYLWQSPTRLSQVINISGDTRLPLSASHPRTPWRSPQVITSLQLIARIKDAPVVSADSNHLAATDYWHYYGNERQAIVGK